MNDEVTVPRSPKRHLCKILMWAGLAGTLVPACKREEVQVYRIEKPQPPSAVAPSHGDRPGEEAAASMAGHPHGDLEGFRPRIEYAAPPGWSEQPAGPMRVASFRVDDSQGLHADVAVIPLRGLTGRTLEMWNLWRQQLGLPEGNAEQMEQSAAEIIIHGHRGRLFDLVTAQTPPGESQRIRIVGAMVDVNNVAWFFKMTGPDSVVTAQKPAFVAWLQSVRFLSLDTPTQASASVEAAEKFPQWEVPAGWQSVPAGAFLVAKFIVGTESEKAEINISRSAGDGGGWINNVNRWRRQLGLAEAGSEEIRQQTRFLELSSAQAMQIELDGTDARTGQPTRVVGVMVPLADEAWFYKLFGPANAVDSEKAAFIRFVQSVRY
ncbi:MAG: hypothetical protein RMN51_01195 [Verrucomicrobiota bacterium]|nr:hypothetical protein [Limisphaera sp.]MDW8380714.1 hypothetical protein [Verrucomicrobiota bacterium]